jgi:hypothetical protein
VSAAWDGKYHRIKVDVRRRGCTVRAQWGYYNPKLFAEYTDLEKLIQLVDLARQNADQPDSGPVRDGGCAVLSDPEEMSPSSPGSRATSRRRHREKVEVVGLAFDAADCRAVEEQGIA